MTDLNMGVKFYQLTINKFVFIISSITFMELIVNKFHNLIYLNSI